MHSIKALKHPKRQEDSQISSQDAILALKKLESEQRSDQERGALRSVSINDKPLIIGGVDDEDEGWTTKAITVDSAFDKDATGQKQMKTTHQSSSS